MAAERTESLDPTSTGEFQADVARRLLLCRLAMELHRGKRIKQKDFAADAGLDQPRYNQVEKGKRPLSLDTALKLAAAHGLSLDWLYRGETALVPWWMLQGIQEIDALNLTDAELRKLNPIKALRPARTTTST